jgi:hypothetical protein
LKSFPSTTTLPSATRDPSTTTPLTTRRLPTTSPRHPSPPAVQPRQYKSWSVSSK